jgi:phage shock protein A
MQGKRRGIERQALAGAQNDDSRRRLHTLSNTLASLRLRLEILAADPARPKTQERNITALVSIADQAIQMLREIQAAAKLDEPGKAAVSSPRRRTGTR